MASTEYISGIIDDLYAGTLDGAAWQRAMVAMADLVRATGTLLLSLNPKTARIFRDEIHRFDPVAVAEYRKHWLAKDIRIEPAVRLPTGEAIYESKLMRLNTFRASEFYNDYLVRVDSPSFLVFYLQKTNDKIVALSLQGSQNREPFDERDGERIKPLLPHVHRALEIKDRLETANIYQDTVGKCLETLNSAVLILDEDARVLEASTSARQLLAADNGMRVSGDGTLWLREPAGRDFNQWIAKGIPPAHNSDGLLHIPRPLGRPLSLMVTRLPAPSPSWLGGARPCWLLLVFDADRQLPASAELIARDLGITAREAEIAALLATGYDLKAVALRLNISVHTARTHLKAIYSKTEIRSQIQLVRRIASGPAMVPRANESPQERGK